MISIDIQPPAASGLLHRPKDDPAKIVKAATDFEALLLAQILKAARAGDDQNQDSTTMIDLGEQQFAQVLATNGGLGIARMVTAGLIKNADR